MEGKIFGIPLILILLILGIGTLILLPMVTLHAETQRRLDRIDRRLGIDGDHEASASATPSASPTETPTASPEESAEPTPSEVPFRTLRPVQTATPEPTPSE